MRVSRYKNPVIGRLVLVLLSPRPWEQKNREIVVAFYVRRRASGALCYTKQFQVTHTHTHTKGGNRNLSDLQFHQTGTGGGGEFLIFSLETLSFTDRQLIVIGVAVNLSGQNVVVRRRIIIGRYIYIDCRVIYLERNE